MRQPRSLAALYLALMPACSEIEYTQVVLDEPAAWRETAQAYSTDDVAAMHELLLAEVSLRVVECPIEWIDAFPPSHNPLPKLRPLTALLRASQIERAHPNLIARGLAIERLW